MKFWSLSFFSLGFVIIDLLTIFFDRFGVAGVKIDLDLSGLGQDGFVRNE